jgi:hypothetical protein
MKFTPLLGVLVFIQKLKEICPCSRHEVVWVEIDLHVSSFGNLEQDGDRGGIHASAALSPVKEPKINRFIGGCLNHLDHEVCGA